MLNQRKADQSIYQLSRCLLSRFPSFCLVLLSACCFISTVVSQSSQPLFAPLAPLFIHFNYIVCHPDFSTSCIYYSLYQKIIQIDRFRLQFVFYPLFLASFLRSSFGLLVKKKKKETQCSATYLTCLLKIQSCLTGSVMLIL